MKEVYSIGKELENNPALMELFKIARKLDRESLQLIIKFSGKLN